jgi:hypothetical protein
MWKLPSPPEGTTRPTILPDEFNKAKKTKEGKT